MDGLSRCIRYAFGPNRLHLCGPQNQADLAEYFIAPESEKGLAFLLRQFKTMYPYLERIAKANSIKDPFDEMVVEAYWIGNELLDNIAKKEVYLHLKDGLKINKKLSPKEFKALCEKLNFGARLHHSFHVFNIWERTGHNASRHTLESMDKCRISWGRVSEIKGPFLNVKTRPLSIDKKGKLALGQETEKRLIRRLENDEVINVKIGGVVSIHWEVPCEILNQLQIENLEKYTELSMNLANRTT